jgi:deoxyribonuclease V
MIAALDVAYTARGAHAAAVLFDDWTSPAAVTERCVALAEVAAYIPGEFYRRELPCLLAALNQLAELPHTILIDGYVWLAPDRPGLGFHLFEALSSRAIIVGVAKSQFSGASSALPVLRGTSAKPLFITAQGIPADVAAKCVASMHGKFRIPTLLQRADALSRIGSEPTAAK